MPCLLLLSLPLLSLTFARLALLSAVDRSGHLAGPARIVRLLAAFQQ